MYDNLPKTKKEALDSGSPQFYTGKPCKRGHLSPRQTKNGTCLDCKKISDAKYREKNPDMAKEYHIANRDIVLARQEIYRNENRDICRAASKRWKENNNDKVKEHQKNYRTNNPEKFRLAIKNWEIKNKDKVIESRKKTKRKHAEKIKAYNARYAKENADKVNARTAERRAMKKLATPSWASSETIRLFYKFAEIYKEKFGGAWHVDHIVPLQSEIACGLHVENNLRVIKAKDNLSKGNKLIEDLL